MPQLLGIRIRNFKSLADVSLGQIAWGIGEPLPELMCFIGPNGCGKSSLLDAFGFMADCLREGVEPACDKPHRGGFAKLRTQGKSDPIQFDLYYRGSEALLPITYTFEIEEVDGVPVVARERLRQRRRGQKTGQPYSFLWLDHGEGPVWAGKSTEKDEGAGKQQVALDDISRLGITTLGQLAEHPRIVGLRSYIENWYLSYFVPEAARELSPARAQKHLDRTGENLGNVVQYLERNFPEKFESILEKIAQRIPGLEKIKSLKSADGRLLLQFNEAGYEDPFYQQCMSDGTLKMFAYLLLLEDPEPASFIGIEEPENGLFHKLLEELAREFRRHAERSKGKIQLLITTHSPYFVDALAPKQVWLMKKNKHGHSVVKRTSDMATIVAMKEEGIPLGSLWYSNHFEEKLAQ